MPKKHLLFAAFSLLHFIQTNAQQGFENRMNRRYPNCSDIAYNCIYLLPKYIDQKEKDSAQALVAYWEDKCGNNEMLQIAKVLNAIAFHSYSDEIIDSSFFRYLSYFKDDISLKKTNPKEYNRDNFKDFYDYTLSLTSYLKANYPEGSIERFLCLCFSEDNYILQLELEKPFYAKTRFKQLYVEELNKAKSKIDVNYAAFVGLWKPYGEAVILGNHPFIGGQVGWRTRGFYYDITMEIRLGESANAYMANHKHSTGLWDSTKHYLGIYFGVDASKVLFQDRLKELCMIAGLGWDGFDAFPNEKHYQNEPTNSATVSSPNINFGFGLKHHNKSGEYFGLQLKYNIVNYTLNDVVHFTGNSLSVRLVYGGLTNEKKQQLRKLMVKEEELNLF